MTTNQTPEQAVDAAVERVMRKVREAEVAYSQYRAADAADKDYQVVGDLHDQHRKHYDVAEKAIRTELEARYEAGRRDALQQEYDRGCPAPCHCEELAAEIGATAYEHDLATPTETKPTPVSKLGKRIGEAERAQWEREPR